MADSITNLPLQPSGTGQTYGADDALPQGTQLKKRKGTEATEARDAYETGGPPGLFARNVANKKARSADEADEGDGPGGEEPQDTGVQPGKGDMGQQLAQEYGPVGAMLMMLLSAGGAGGGGAGGGGGGGGGLEGTGRRESLRGGGEGYGLGGLGGGGGGEDSGLGGGGIGDNGGGGAVPGLGVYVPSARGGGGGGGGEGLGLGGGGGGEEYGLGGIGGGGGGGDEEYGLGGGGGGDEEYGLGGLGGGGGGDEEYGLGGGGGGGDEEYGLGGLGGGGGGDEEYGLGGLGGGGGGGGDEEYGLGGLGGGGGDEEYGLGGLGGLGGGGGDEEYGLGGLGGGGGDEEYGLGGLGGGGDEEYGLGGLGGGGGDEDYGLGGLGGGGGGGVDPAAARDSVTDPNANPDVMRNTGGGGGGVSASQGSTGGVRYQQVAGGSLWGADGQGVTGATGTTNGISDAVQQTGNVGDCYFLASLSGAAAQDPNSVKSMIRPDPNGNPHDYQVRFYSKDPQTNQMTPEWVSVNDQLPVDANGQGGGAGLPKDSSGNPILAPALIEKAFAKFNDEHQLTEGEGVQAGAGYNGIGNGGTGIEALEAITGQPSSTVGDINATGSLADQNVGDNEVQSALEQANPPNHTPTIAGSVANPGDGIVGSHEYTVLGTYQQGGQTMVSLRNPWGTNDPNNSNDPNQGVVSVSLDQFKKDFSTVTTADGKGTNDDPTGGGSSGGGGSNPGQMSAFNLRNQFMRA